MIRSTRSLPKQFKDYYLHQLVDFLTGVNNTLDLLLTNIPDKVIDVHGFEDHIDTDHTLASFDQNLNICKKPKIKRSVYNFKKAMVEPKRNSNVFALESRLC